MPEYKINTQNPNIFVIVLAIEQFKIEIKKDNSNIIKRINFSGINLIRDGKTHSLKMIKCY
jgi:hypothetical protein